MEVTLPGACEAMDGRARAHMDVLVAFPGRVTSTAAPLAACTTSNHRRPQQILIEFALLFAGAHPIRDADHASFPTIVKDVTRKP